MIIEVYVESGDVARVDAKGKDFGFGNLGPADFLEKALDQINDVGYLCLPGTKSIVAINADKILFIKVLKDEEEKENADV